MDSSIENTLFYSFSTISQTIGGIIAFLGAFLLYRFELFHRHMNLLRVQIEERLGGAFSTVINSDDFREHVKWERYNEAMEMFKDVDEKDDLKRGCVKFLNKLIEVSEFKKKLTNRFIYKSMIPSFILIIFSVVILNFTPSLICYKNWVFLFGGIGVIYCLISYGSLIKIALEPFNIPKKSKSEHK